METIFNIYSQQINEDIASMYVRMFKQDLERIRDNKFKKIIDELYLDNILWDKVTDEDIEVLDVHDPDEKELALKLFRAVRAQKDWYIGRSHRKIEVKDHSIIIFAYLDGKLKYVYSSRTDRLKTIGRSGVANYDRPRDMEDHLRDSDTWYVLSYKNLNISGIQMKRSESVHNIVPTPDAADRKLKHNVQGELGKNKGGTNSWDGGVYTNYCKQLVNKAMDRYRKIIAQNKYKRTADTKEIEDLVKKCLDGYTKAMNVALNNPKEYQYKLSGLNNLIQGSVEAYRTYNNGKGAAGYIVGGLLKTFQQYVNASMSMASNSGSEYTDIYMKDREDAEKALRKIAGSIKNELANFGISI